LGESEIPVLIPYILYRKVCVTKKVIYWGHGRDLLDINACFKNISYALQEGISDSIIIYAEHLKKPEVFFIRNYL